jgi:hypothetical protein
MMRVTFRGAAQLANYEAPGEITAALRAHLVPPR